MADPKQTPAVPASITLRVRVVTRAGRGLSNAMVRVETGSATREITTGSDGTAKLALAPSDLNAPQVTVTVKKRHHAPDDGTSTLPISGEFKVAVPITSTGFDETAPGVRKGKEGVYLEVRLIDGGFRFAAASGSKRARRLTNDEVLHELMHRCLQGDVVLDAQSDIVFEHDATSGEFDPCDPTRCKLKAPQSDRRVSLREPKLAGVTFLYLDNYFPSSTSPSDVPGQRFLRDKFVWLRTPLQLLDQRHVVGLTRLCEYLRSTHAVAAIYTIGVNGDVRRTDCHGYGTAIDLGGVAKQLPEAGKNTIPTRLGIDFIVPLHWGNVPMWDRALVASEPTNPAKWKRLVKSNDDLFDYAKAKPSKDRLHYRLDPAPYQEPLPPSTDPALASELAKLGPHFDAARSIFLDIYNFATSEFSDNNDDLGPLPPGAVDVPTPIDGHHGGRVLHPDYPSPNSPPTSKNPHPKDGREAHVNHFHFQFGPTYFKNIRTT